MKAISIGIALLILCGCDDRPQPRVEEREEDAHIYLIIYRDEAQKVTCYGGRGDRFACVADPCPVMDGGSQ